jgi:hypothetical protein
MPKGDLSHQLLKADTPAVLTELAKVGLPSLIATGSCPAP